VLAYDSQWHPLTEDDLKKLEPGDVVFFAVSGTTSEGTFDKAKFTINGEEKPEVTKQKPESGEFYFEYEIPEGVSSFEVTAKIHHTILGWL